MSLLHPFPKHVRKFRWPGRAGQLKRSVGRHRELYCEPLEERLFLNADPMAATPLTLADSDLAAAYVAANLATPESPENETTSPGRFTSANELREYLIEQAVEKYRHLFGQPANYGMWRNYTFDVVSDTALVLRSAATGDVAFSHSETNVQVEGVDEGDLVETDGEFLYVLSGKELMIVDAWPADELQVVSRTEIEGGAFAVYLRGDRLTILSHPSGGLNRYSGYGYYAGGGVTVAVLDVSDRDAPQLVQKTTLDGRYVDSRAVGDHVFVVMQEAIGLPGPQRIPVNNDLPQSDEICVCGNWHRTPSIARGSYIYETLEQYLDRIRDLDLDTILPTYTSFDSGGQLASSGLLSEATDVYRPLDDDIETMTTVVTFNMAGDTPGPVSSTTVPSAGGVEIFMTGESLYLWQTDRWYSGNIETPIQKFDLDASDGTVHLAARGSVPGRVLNQFSMDEHEGLLRVATTNGRAGRWEGQGDSWNGLYVLEQNGAALDIVGRLEDLAPGEKIYSARFLGDRAFVVTYRKVDPLFAIDLSDPAQPRVEGQLKIPGFSNYLHPVGEDYLIGVGRHADEDTGLFQDPQVSLFNIADLSDPQLVDRFTIPTGRTGGQDIFDDHHTIAYYPEHQVLTVSVPQFELGCQAVGPGWGSFGFVASEVDHLWVVEIDVSASTDVVDGSSGIQFLGQIAHGSSSVTRSVRVGDYLYAISSTKITAHEILSPDTQVAQVRFAAFTPGDVEASSVPQPEPPAELEPTDEIRPVDPPAASPTDPGESAGTINSDAPTPGDDATTRTATSDPPAEIPAESPAVVSFDAAVSSGSADRATPGPDEDSGRYLAWTDLVVTGRSTAQAPWTAFVTPPVAINPSHEAPGRLHDRFALVRKGMAVTQRAASTARAGLPAASVLRSDAAHAWNAWQSDSWETLSLELEASISHIARFFGEVRE